MKHILRIGHSARTALATTALALCGIAGNAEAQFEITTGTGSATQNFDSLTITGGGSGAPNQTWTNDATLAVGDSTLDGWSLFNFSNGAISLYNGGIGNNSSGGFYSFGASGVNERALGGLGSGGAYFGSPPSGTVAGYIAFAATNNSTSSLTSFTLGFDGEQWRNGGNTSPQTMTLQYGFGATFDVVTTWAAPGGAFDWTSPVTGSTAAAVDGNGVGNVTGRGGTINGLNWIAGDTLWVRWIELNDVGNDHGLAIDNFSFSWIAASPPKSLIWTPLTNAWNAAAINWIDSSNNNAVAFSAGDSVTFDDTGLPFNNVSVDAGGVAPSNVTVSTTGTYTLSGGPISAVNPLQKSGSGTLVLGSVYFGGLNATAGTVRTAANEVFGDTSGVTLGEGVTFDLNGNNETVGAIGMTGSTITTGAGLLTINGNITFSASAIDTPSTISGNLSTGAANRKFILSDSGAAEDLILNANLSGSGRVDFDGAGTVRIAGNNSAFSGGLQMDSDSGLTYVLAGTNPIGTGQLFLNGGIVRAAVPFFGATALAAPVSLGGNGVVFDGQNIEFSGALTFFGNGVKTYTVADGQIVKFSGTLDSSKQGTNPVPNSAITKAGPGILALYNDGSAYTGAFTIAGGTVVVATANALGTGGVTMTASAPDAITLNPIVSTTIGALSSSGDGTIKTILGAGAPSVTPVVLTISSDSDGTYEGSIETAAGHVGGVVKAGIGTETLSGPQSYATLKVEDGMLVLGGELTSPGGSDIDVTPTGITATLDITRSETVDSLTIGPGGVVSLTAPPAPAPLVAAGDDALAGAGPAQAVPEPGSAALVLGGIATMLGLRRRR